MAVEDTRAAEGAVIETRVVTITHQEIKKLSGYWTVEDYVKAQLLKGGIRKSGLVVAHEDMEQGRNIYTQEVIVLPDGAEFVRTGYGKDTER